MSIVSPATPMTRLIRRLAVRGVGVDHDDIPMAGLVRQTVDDQQLLIMQGGVHGMPVHTDGPCGKGEHKEKATATARMMESSHSSRFLFFLQRSVTAALAIANQAPLAWHRN